MIFLLALLPATMLTIAGYFVLYLSARTEGALHSFGKYLAFWAFTLAGLVILGALFATARHRHPMGGWHPMPQRMGAPWPAHPPMQGPGNPMPPGGPAAPGPAAPGAPPHAPNP